MMMIRIVTMVMALLGSGIGSAASSPGGLMVKLHELAAMRLARHKRAAPG